MKGGDNCETYVFPSLINTISQQNYPEHFPMHWHKYVEVLAVEESQKCTSEIEIRLNQEVYHLGAGDMMFIWPGELHEIVQNTEHRIIAIQFPYTALSEIQDFLRLNHMFRSHHLMKYNLEPELNEAMLLSLKHIMELSTQYEKPFHNVEMRITLYEMFMCFGTFLQEKEGKAKFGKDGVEKMQLACLYIQENCETSLSLDKVAEYVGFSSCYFSRCFKRETGYSFVEYLMRQRVKRMQMLLTDMHISITDAAYQSGFKSISTLNRIFKQYSGCSPSEYRKYYSVSM